jgi:hypothetical protein
VPLNGPSLGARKATQTSKPSSKGSKRRGSIIKDALLGNRHMPYVRCFPDSHRVHPFSNKSNPYHNRPLWTNPVPISNSSFQDVKMREDALSCLGSTSLDFRQQTFHSLSASPSAVRTIATPSMAVIAGDLYTLGGCEEIALLENRNVYSTRWEPLRLEILYASSGEKNGYEMRLRKCWKKWLDKDHTSIASTYKHEISRCEGYPYS